jgi:hypothetical protein
MNFYITLNSLVCTGGGIPSLCLHQPNIKPSPCRPCEGLSYIVYDSQPRNFFQALSNAPGGCYLAPPKEVQDNYAYLQQTFGLTDADFAWVGAWKDPSLVIAKDGTKPPGGDGVSGWIATDGSPWHVTKGDPLGYWKPNEPDNFPGSQPENVIVVGPNAKMADVSPTTYWPAFFKCCYDICE